MLRAARPSNVVKTEEKREDMNGLWLADVIIANCTCDEGMDICGGGGSKAMIEAATLFAAVGFRTVLFVCGF